MRRRNTFNDVTMDHGTQGGISNASSRKEAAKKGIPRTWKEDDGWMMRKIYSTPDTLIKPAWSRNLGSGFGLGCLPRILTGCEEQRLVRNLGLIYIVLMILACFTLPTEVMIGWIALNGCVAYFLMRHPRAEREERQDLVHRTFYEPPSYLEGPELRTLEKIPRSGLKKKKLVKMEAYELRTEKVDQRNFQRGNMYKHRGNGAICFPDSGSSDDGEQLVTRSQLIGKITFEDQSSDEERTMMWMRMKSDVFMDSGLTPSMRMKEITLFIRTFEGPSKVLTITLGSSVGMMKQELMGRGAPVTRDSKFLYGGKILQDSAEVWQTGAGEGSTFFLILPIRGGSNGGKKASPSAAKGKRGQNSSCKDSSEIIIEPKAQECNIYEGYEFDLFLLESARESVNPEYVYKVYSDGASRGNPGPCGVGIVIYDPVNKEVYRDSMSLRQGTNNFSEYCAAIYALRTAINLGIERAQLYCDSELLVKQFNGVFQVNGELKPYYLELKSLSEKFDNLSVEWIPGQSNRVADCLAKQAIKGGTTELKPSESPNPQLSNPTEVIEERKVENTKKINKVPGPQQKTLLDYCRKSELNGKKNEMTLEKSRGPVECGITTKVNLKDKQHSTEEARTRVEDGSSKEKEEIAVTSEMQFELPKVMDNLREVNFAQGLRTQVETKEVGFQTEVLSYGGVGTLINCNDKWGQVVALRESCPKVEDIRAKNWEDLTKNRFVEETLTEHEGKLVLLGDYTFQVIEKVKELAFTWDEMWNYGTNILEPWRNEVSNTIRVVLEGAETLQNTVGNIYGGCINLENRISQLEGDLLKAMKENDFLRGEMEGMRARIDRLEAGRLGPEMEIEGKVIANHRIDAISLELDKRLEELKLGVGLEISRLESLILERLVDQYRLQKIDPSHEVKIPLKSKEVRGEEYDQDGNNRNTSRCKENEQYHRKRQSHLGRWEKRDGIEDLRQERKNDFGNNQMGPWNKIKPLSREKRNKTYRYEKIYVPKKEFSHAEPTQMTEIDKNTAPRQATHSNLRGEDDPGRKSNGTLSNTLKSRRNGSRNRPSQEKSHLPRFRWEGTQNPEWEDRRYGGLQRSLSRDQRDEYYSERGRRASGGYWHRELHPRFRRYDGNRWNRGDKNREGPYWSDSNDWNHQW